MSIRLWILDNSCNWAVMVKKSQVWCRKTIPLAVIARFHIIIDASDKKNVLIAW
jgi:hypothetical protein